MRFREIHPGVILKEEAEARGLSGNALALKLRVPPQRIQEIIGGRRAITPDTALRLGRFLGIEPEHWLAMQSNYDLAMARKQKQALIEAEVNAG